VLGLWASSHGAAKGLYLSSPAIPHARLGPRGQRFVRDFGATRPGVPVVSSAVYAAAATEVLLDAIARSDGTRASVANRLLATRLEDGILGSLRFDANGDVSSPLITILRIRRGSGAGNVPNYEGADIDRVVASPAGAVR
jgi:ABC-type branched-subunit amino acid transport system substrate-binding protein